MACVWASPCEADTGAGPGTGAGKGASDLISSQQSIAVRGTMFLQQAQASAASAAPAVRARKAATSHAT